MRTLPLVGAALLLTSLLWSAVAAQPTGPRTIEANEVGATIEALSGETSTQVDGADHRFSSRHIHHPDHPLAVTWIEASMAAIDGLSVRREVFSGEGRDDLTNLVGELPGADSSRPLILVGAHLDSTGSADGGYDPEVDPAPGADDDASGIAALLAVAEVLAPLQLEATVRFVAFDAEEHGLLGSWHHAEQLDAEVELMFSLDPIGHNPGDNWTLWVTYDTRFPEAADGLLPIAEAQGALAVSVLDASLIGGDPRSDQFPFWENNIPALHLASFPQPLEYHSAEDTMAVVDPAFTAAVANVVAAMVVERAGLVPPSSDADGSQGSPGCGCAQGAATRR
jgi:hypothetical protein